MENQSEEVRAAVLRMLPQQHPFRFVDRILELSEERIVSQYRFRDDEYFYQGHFPGDPVTPGVILVETMAQTGLVALGLFLVSKEKQNKTIRTLFTECHVEFSAMVRPGSLVTVVGERKFWRRNKLQSMVTLSLEDGTVAASGLVSGIGVIVPPAPGE